MIDFKKIPWFPQMDKKAYATIYSFQMLVSYFIAAGFFIGLFFIPFVEEITGIKPWEMTLVGAMHFCGGMLPGMVFRKADVSKILIWESFSDRCVMSSIALFGSPDASFLWLFLVFISVIEAASFRPSVYSGSMIFIAPFATWALFIFLDLREFSTHDLAVMSTVCLMTLIVWLFISSATSQYRNAQREVETSKAQAELERNRANLSRDIHDAIAAIFTRILATQKDETGTIANLTRDGLAQLRDIVTALQAQNTSLEFLSSWMNHYSQQYFEGTGVEPRFTAELIDPTATLEPIRIIHVMRIYQELCQNVVKHARASESKIILSQTAKQVTIEFSDNGKGLAQTADGNGFKNIRHRVAELGGSFKTIPANGAGLHSQLIFSV